MTFPAWHLARIVETAVRLVRAAAPGGVRSILDLGCGDGATSRAIAARLGAPGGPARVVGIDHDAEVLAAARARGVAAIEAFVSDAPRLFRRDFDLAHAYGVAELLPELGALVWTMLSAVRPGGLALLSFVPPGSMADVWYLAARAGGLGVRYHVATPSDVAAVLTRVPLPCRLVAVAPIWHFYTARPSLLRLDAPRALWNALDLAARAARRPPAAVYALVERTR